MKTVDWSEMTHEELTAAMSTGRRETARRLKELSSLLGMEATGKRGRPASNPLAEILEGDDETEDVAAAVS